MPVLLPGARYPLDHAAFPVLRADPWTPDEVDLWPHDARAALEHYLPQARQLVANYGLQLPERIDVPNSAPTESAPGYQPPHNFISFLREPGEREHVDDAAVCLVQTG